MTLHTYAKSRRIFFKNWKNNTSGLITTEMFVNLIWFVKIMTIILALELYVRIPLEAWMSICIYSVFVLCRFGPCDGISNGPRSPTIHMILVKLIQNGNREKSLSRQGKRRGRRNCTVTRYRFMRLYVWYGTIKVIRPTSTES
jgi:hypothetical protein